MAVASPASTLQIDCFVSSHIHLPGWVFMRRRRPLASLIKGDILSSARPFVHGHEISLVDWDTSHLKMKKSIQ